MGRPVDSDARKRPGSFPNGNRNACVEPVSALELCRRSMKRRRGMQLQLQNQHQHQHQHQHPLQAQQSRGEFESPFARSSSNAPLPLSLCLLRRPGLSLPHGLTELAGPAGAGKTQLALSLCADCVQRHPSARAVYLSLGGSGRSLSRAAGRLRDMLLERERDSRWRCGGSGDNTTTNTSNNANTNANDNASEEWVHGCLTRVLLRWICNTEELTDVLLNKLPPLLRRHHPTVSVVVLDGIASLFRVLPEEMVAGGMGNRNNSDSSNDSDSSNNSTIRPWHDRALAFFELSNLCKKLSSRFGIPVLVVNECTSKILPGSGGSGARPVLEPALGLAWSQCVNASFFVVRAPRATAAATDAGGGGLIRVLRCRKAPHISSERPGTEFRIDRSGTTAFPERQRAGGGTPR